jgi:hypothetical protein
LRSKKPAGLSMNEGLRVSMGGRVWAWMRNSATTCVAVELLRAEDRLGGCPDQAGLGGLYDGGHGADQPPESLDCRGLAGDVDVGV